MRPYIWLLLLASLLFVCYCLCPSSNFYWPCAALVAAAALLLLPLLFLALLLLLLHDAVAAFGNAAVG